MEEAFVNPVPYYGQTTAEVEADRREHAEARRVGNVERMIEIEQRLRASGNSLAPTPLDEQRARVARAKANLELIGKAKKITDPEFQAALKIYTASKRVLADLEDAQRTGARIAGPGVQTDVAAGVTGEAADNAAVEPAFMDPPKPWWMD